MAAVAAALAAILPSASSAAAATTAAASTATAATAATSAFSTMSLLSTSATIFSGLSAIAQGNAQARQYEIEAANKEAEGRTALVNGLREQNDQTDALLDTLARQRVALAGSGADLSTGALGQIFGDATRRGDQQRRSSELDAAINARAARLSSRGLLAAASGARLGGFANAAGAVGQWAMRRAERG